MSGRAVHFLYLFTALFILMSAAQAGIQFDATRVIYPEGKKETTLGLKNEAGEPRLIQAWVDAGEGNDTRPPFIIMPPIFRIDPGKGQSLRISFIGGDIPRDRESVFWINVLEVSPPPPGKKAGTHDYIQFPVRSRLKLFYRPKGLRGSPKEAISQLHWRLLREDDALQLECTNPSAFNVSFSNIQLTPPSETDEKTLSGMCPAKGGKVFNIQRKQDIVHGKIFFSIIDDRGAHENVHIDNYY